MATTTLTRPQTTDGSDEGALTAATLGAFGSEFAANPVYRMAQNAVTQITVDDIALNRGIVTNTDHSFSTFLDDWGVTNQKQSGRCWMFAGLNLLRVAAMKKMNTKEFEFSQNYTMFWDKLERANYFFEAIIETADRDVDDRLVAFLLDGPLGDGGQWNMFVNLVNKHGLVPKAFMPETESSSSTRKMNAILRTKLREGAKALRDMHAAGESIEALRTAKQEYVQVVHRILSIHLGTPPETFVWQWKDKDGAFHRTDEVTPQEFAAQFVDLQLDDYVCLVHDPRQSSPVGRTFTVQYLGNIVGGERVTYLNVESSLMKEITQRTLEDGNPVWFGCDVGKMMRRDLGIWDKDLFEYGAVYDTSFDLGKDARLEYHETQMTHAMLFTGVDVVDGTPRRWRVENSWGAENGQKGFYTMNDSWYDEYMFEIAARKEYLPADLRAALDQEPIVLPAWDPMGALAH
jgi:bleomycin hydrolase